MIDFLKLIVHLVVSPFKTRAQLEAAIVLLRHQLNVLRRRVSSRPKLATADRLLFVWLYRLFPSMLNTVAIVQPETIIRWHRTGFRLYWRWKSRARGGRPKVTVEIRRLIREMSLANRLSGDLLEQVDRPIAWRIFTQRQMCSEFVVIAGVGRKDSALMGLAEDDDVIEACPADRTDQSLRMLVLPR